MPHAFTTAYNRLSNVLINEVRIAPAFDPKILTKEQHPAHKTYAGIWDTGATSSVITKKVVEELNLQPTGMVQVSHCQGTAYAETYFVNIILPNGIGFSQLKVIKGDLSPGADALIGMDIINQGDFAVSNFNGKTIFSYIVPSAKHIDFTGKYKDTTSPSVPIKIGRNDYCPCGSGKKYKKCCGMNLK